jgi:septal ring factor EnvC (AmiA/AmiB activator)
VTEKPHFAGDPARHAALAILIVAGGLSASGAALGEEGGQRLQEVERAVQENQAQSQALSRRAAGLRQEIESLQGESVTTARKMQDLETRLTEIEDRLARLELERDAKAAALDARRGQLYHTLAALQRIAVQPTEALLVGPGTPVERVRSAMLLKAAIPAIEDRAERLRRDLVELASLRTEIERQRTDLAATATALSNQRGRLDELLDRKRSLHATTLGEREHAQTRAARLAAEAKDLRELISRLEQEARERAEREQAAREDAERAAREQAQLEEAEREARESAAEQQRATPPKDEQQLALAPGPAPRLDRPANVRPFPADPASAALVMPVRGRLVNAYGKPKAAGQEAAKGITIITRAQAQVVAPYDGQVVYAGTFRGYGQILIIEHGGRYHTLLAGLERIDAVVGQWILAGEPIGVMGSPQGGNPELYLELRRTGQPVNPLPWLATTDNKVQG